MTSISRRLFLTSFPASAVGPIAYARLIEPRWLQLSTRTCPLPTLKAPVDLVHLSDLHASDVVPKTLIEHALVQAAAIGPDLICITGDFVTHAKGFDRGWY